MYFFNKAFLFNSKKLHLQKLKELKKLFNKKILMIRIRLILKIVYK